MQPLPYQLGNAPTIGQALYVLVFLAMNIILTSINYQSKQPNAWYATKWQEIVAYIFYRTGVLAYIFMPLVFLFASRNNVLLWMTDWSHSTFLVLHRWIARVFALQALLHSVLALVLYLENGNYATEHSKPYWIWGIISTLGVVILTFASGLYVRRFHYEIFLLTHIVLTVIVIVGCWYHVYDLYAFLGAYEDWLYAVAAVWFFDRVIRVLRIIVSGPQYAKVTDLGNRYMRIDVPGLHWGMMTGKHAYFYFPTLTPLRPWENHPFSLIPSAMLHGPLARSGSSNPNSPASASLKEQDMEKQHDLSTRVQSLPEANSNSGITLFLRQRKGATSALRTQARLLTFVEGQYANHSTSKAALCDRLLLIGGGIGITALVPFTANHFNVKLCWSLKESARCLLDELQGTLHRVADKEIIVGQRIDVHELLAAEIRAGWKRVGVIVAGPGELCDNVTAAVVKAAKMFTPTSFELEVEAYSW